MYMESRQDSQVHFIFNLFYLHHEGLNVFKGWFRWRVVYRALWGEMALIQYIDLLYKVTFNYLIYVFLQKICVRNSQLREFLQSL